ncbi:MAG: alpha/beta fold hydrolase [Victivallales bacterium]|nr:alpha/beta fold hydrolase [Victivallales bacterium]
MAWRELYTFKPNYIKTDEGQRLHYVDEGSGHPMVMVHGNPTWSFIFRDLIREASACGHRAIAPDLLGCGLSDKPQDWPYRLDGHIRNLEQLLDDTLKLDKMTLVLHDWGGCVGMGYATRHPEKIDRLVLMNTAAFISDDCPKAVYLCRCPFIGAFLVRGLNAFVEAALRRAVVHKLPEAVRAGYRFPYGNWHDRIATQRFVQDLPLTPQDKSYTTFADIEAKLPLFKDIPVSLIWGEQDFCIHTGFMKRWQQIYPNAETHLFHDAGHYLLEDAGEEVIRLILKQ